MIPSVTMLCDIPEKPDDSFYRGQVFVGLKNAVLEASSPLRHATELGKILSQEGFSSPLLLLYTDGGPDHNLAFLTVQLSLIALFIHFDLDMIVAVKTAPYHSWKNPCERVNCILNLGLQAVGLMRATMEEKFEKVISGCNSMDIRKEVEKVPGLKEAVLDSVEPVKALISSLFMWLSLKDKNFRCFSAASTHEMEGLFDHLHDIEPNLTASHRSKECISKLSGLKQFIDHCCHIRKYVFSVKKCGKQDCSICSPPRLPPEIFSQLFHLPDPVPASSDHYKPFEEVYGTHTTEKHRPSFSESRKSGHGIPFSPNAQTARKLIMCTECLKPRVLYAQRKLSHNDEAFLQQKTTSTESDLEGLIRILSQTTPNSIESTHDLIDSTMRAVNHFSSFRPPAR